MRSLGPLLHLEELVRDRSPSRQFSADDPRNARPRCRDPHRPKSMHGGPYGCCARRRTAQAWCASSRALALAQAHDFPPHGHSAPGAGGDAVRPEMPPYCKARDGFKMSRALCTAQPEQRVCGRPRRPWYLTRRLGEFTVSHRGLPDPPMGLMSSPVVFVPLPIYRPFRLDMPAKRLRQSGGATARGRGSNPRRSAGGRASDARFSRRRRRWRTAAVVRPRGHLHGTSPGSACARRT